MENKSRIDCEPRHGAAHGTAPVFVKRTERKEQ